MTLAQATEPKRARPVRQYLRIAVLRLAFLLMLPLMLFTRSAWSTTVRDLLEVAGILAIIAAVLGRFWAILYIGGRKNKAVMDEGPYSVCRHPLYLFSTIGVIGLGLMLGSVLVTAVLGGVVFAVLSVTASREEHFLRASLGPDYGSYARRVPRILPRLGLFRTSDHISVNIGALRGNLLDALVFLSLIPLAELVEYLHDTAGLATISLW